VPDAEVVVHEEGGHAADYAHVTELYRWLVEPA
jgi:hypothetical protein